MPTWCSTPAGAGPRWATGSSRPGVGPPVVENHAVGIAYFSRWYRVRPGGPANPGRVWDISIAPFAIGLVFPSDNDVFAVTVALPVGDPTRATLRDPAVFDSVARLFPACRAWLALDHKAVGDVQVMAGLDNRWTALVDERGPVVTGLVNVGDSFTHTNPTLGQGAALALLAAQRVATTYDGAAGFERDYHDWAVRTLKPWFDHQVTIDRGDEAFLSGAFDPHAQPPPLDDAARAQFAANTVRAGGSGGHAGARSGPPPCAHPRPGVRHPGGPRAPRPVARPAPGVPLDAARAFPGGLGGTDRRPGGRHVVKMAARCSSSAAADTGAHRKPTCPSGRMR